MSTKEIERTFREGKRGYLAAQIQRELAAAQVPLPDEDDDADELEVGPAAVAPAPYRAPLQPKGAPYHPKWVSGPSGTSPESRY